MEKNKGVVLTIILLAFALVILLVWASLSYIPLFNINQIEVEGVDNIPLNIEKLLAPYYGVNRFKVDKSALLKEINELSIVDTAAVSFRFPALMVVNIVLFVPQALSSCDNEYFIVKNDQLIKCQKSDFKAYPNLPVVEIATSYKEYLKKFGVDGSFKEVLCLISDITLRLEGNLNLITRVKYDNNNSNSFGAMELEMGSLNTVLSVRDKVDAKQIIEAVKLIEKLSREDNTYLLSGSEHRFDLYKHAMVKRK